MTTRIKLLPSFTFYYSILLLGLYFNTANCFGKQISVLCIGDSITEGYGCTDVPSYTIQLQEILGENYNVTNAGKSGKTQLKKGLCHSYSTEEGDCTYWDTDEWKSAQSSDADIVTIMLGTNDAKSFNWEGVQQNMGDFYALDYVDMIRIMRKNNKKRKVYIMIPPPLYQNSTGQYPFSMNATIINKILPTLIPDISIVMETEFINLFQAILTSGYSPTELSCDGCHPTDVSNQIIATTMAKFIEKGAEEIILN